MLTAIWNLEKLLVFMSYNSMSGMQVGSQASRRVSQQLVWIQPVWISIFSLPAQKGFRGLLLMIIHVCTYIRMFHCWCFQTECSGSVEAGHIWTVQISAACTAERTWAYSFPERNWNVEIKVCHYKLWWQGFIIIHRPFDDNKMLVFMWHHHWDYESHSSVYKKKGYLAFQY